MEEKDNKIFLIYLSSQGKELAKNLKNFFGEAKIFRLDKKRIAKIWKREHILIFIMALGIVIRMCAKFIRTKKTDPGIIAIDEDGKNVIAVLGGHYAKVNEIVKNLSLFLNSHPVITTASDIKNLPALDRWIEKNKLIIKNESMLPKIMSKLNERRVVNVYVEGNIKIPMLSVFNRVSVPEEADIIISHRIYTFSDKLCLIPKNIWAGVGFHEVLTEEEIEENIKQALELEGYEFKALKGIATLDKKTEYLPLKNFCLKYNLKLLGFSKEELEKVEGVNFSEKVNQALGIKSVSEASAILASRGKLLVNKKVFKDFTIALAKEPFETKGKLYIVGIGPGAHEYLTLKALEALSESEAVVRYKTYIEFIKELIKGKEVYSFSMTEELRRAKKAIELALEGKIVSLVCGGDPGIYGLSGSVLEILWRNKIELDVEIISGISALNICSSLCGAPLMCDFAVISLSDRLVSWKEIEKRLISLSQIDIPLVIYNPKSKKRKTQFEKAIQILLTYRDKNTPVAIVNSATREGESIVFTSLEKISKERVGMNTTLIIGSSKSFFANTWFITQRGYEKKYEDAFKISPFDK